MDKENNGLSISKLKIDEGDEEYLYIEKLEEEWAKRKEKMSRTRKRLSDDFVDFDDFDVGEIGKDVEQLRKEEIDRASKAADMRNKNMTEYLKTENLKDFANDVRHYGHIYVFSFAYAKLHGEEYWKFIKSFSREDGKVYIGRDPTSLAKLIAPTLEEEDLLISPSKQRGGELKRGLYEIAFSLHSQEDVGLLLTDKEEKEVFSKFKEYFELDYLEPLDGSWSTLVYEKDEILPLPPNSSADSMLSELQDLGMPVELSGRIQRRSMSFNSSEGRNLKLTKRCVVCVMGNCTTENNANILKLLKKKMRPSFITLRCHWIASTGKTQHYNFLDNVSKGCLPGEPDFKWS